MMVFCLAVIGQLNRFLLKTEKTLIVVLLSVMILLAFLQVILRQFFSMGFLWADVFLRHLVLWVGFLGAAIATQEGKHFAIDLVKKFFPERIRKIVEIVTNAFAVGCLLFIADAAVRFFKDEKEIGTILFTVGRLQVPSYWLNLIIPLGFILILIHFFLKLAEDFVLVFKREVQ